MAGLRVGDRIRSINGQRLADREAAESLLKSCRAGQSIQLAILRGQEEIKTHAQMMDLANELHDRGDIDERESFIDATFASAKGGGAQIGKTRRGKGVKILAIVDRHELPLSVSTPPWTR